MLNNNESDDFELEHNDDEQDVDNKDYLLDEQKIKNQWQTQLKNDPKVIAYFKNYFGNVLDSFLEHYIDQKYLYHKYSDTYSSMYQSNQVYWINEAHEQLESILQKKLFDKNCLWRAEQLEIEGVLVSHDFDMWERDIFNCPFIDPITQDDINLYQKFLTTTNLERYDLKCDGSWQDYSAFKNKYIDNNDDESETLPAWYEYHNNKTGNGSLLILPNVRGTKEDFYLQLYWDDVMEERKKEPDYVEYIPDQRPFFSVYDEENIKAFIDKFEDPKTKKYYQYFTARNKSIFEDPLKDTIENILEADELIPVEAHYDIKQAIEIAYNKYQMKKLAEYLPIAYEQYIFNKNMNLSFSEKRDNFYVNLREGYIAKIKKGRVLNGEPNDLNF
jgi:hypothetical protein